MMSKLLLCLAASNSLSWAFRIARRRQAAVPLWNDEQFTVSGCKCKDQCNPGIFSNFKCDTCKTEGRCGKASVSGRWDYCHYPQDTDYESQTYTEKTQYIWTNIQADKRRLPDEEVTNPVKAFVTSPVTTFENWRPEMPEGRQKVIHSIGSVCQVSLEIGPNSPYTGLLGPGTQRGFVRIGNAVKIEPYGLTPGFGFKFPRSGVPSGDFVALYDLINSQSWNFFKKNFSNHIPPASDTPSKVLARKFGQTTQCATQVGLSDMAKFTQDGQAESEPKFPFKLFLVPGDDVQQDETKKTYDDLHGLIDSIPIGSTLFKVYACGDVLGDETKPTLSVEASCGKPLFLGEMKTSSQCTVSNYGDRAFFIRHQRIEEDWEAKPEWFNKYDVKAACSSVVEKVSIGGSFGTCMFNTDA